MTKQPKPLTKSQLISQLAEETGLGKQEVTAVLTGLEDIIQDQLTGNNSPGQITVNGLFKIVTQEKPALPRREVRNPFTGETKWADPKPASTAVKIRPLKRLKDMV